jgi:hypothetical protein
LYGSFILFLADRFEGDTGKLIKITNPIPIISRCKNSKQIQPKLQKKTSINLIFLVDVRPFRQLPELHQIFLLILNVKLAAERATSQFKGKVGNRAGGFSSICFEEVHKGLTHYSSFESV